MLASVADALEAEKVSKSDNPLLEPVLNIASAWQKEQTTDQTALQRQSPAEAIKLTFQWPLTQSNPNEGVPPEPQANGAS